jgi:hypothetical protein
MTDNADLTTHSLWDTAVRIASDAMFVVQCRPPRKGERYVISDYLFTADHDWTHVNLMVVVSTLDTEALR